MQPDLPLSRQALTLRYPQASELYADGLHLCAQLQPDAVAWTGEVRQPLLLRDALAALFAVVRSDYRYVPKDRSAYLAYSQMRRSHPHQGLAQAQRAYFQWLAEHDPLAWCILDPIVSVHPDGLSLEVFSQDEGSYAYLHLAPALFTVSQPVQYGTTNIDFSLELAQALEQLRSTRPTRLVIGQQAVGLHTETHPETGSSGASVIEKQIQVPHSWLRGLLQVQAAAQLPATVIQLRPIDVYNCLHYLRLHADAKGKRRGLRLELVPKQTPRLVLEPHNVVIPTHAAPYTGQRAQVIRLWGRRRLALLARFLSHADSIEVHLLGNGMPSFWVLRSPYASLTLGITGFTRSNWSQALNFDLLLPRRTETLAELTTVITYLQTQWFASLAQIAHATQLPVPTCQAALQQACQQGRVCYDVAQAVYRYRPLMPTPLELHQLQFRHPEEKLAYDLVSRIGAIGPLNINLIPNVGVEFSATLQVAEARRDYLSRLKLNEEGQVTQAECSCPAFLRNGLSLGPCSHLIALRLAYAAHWAQRDVQTITQETRSFSRRKAAMVTQVQVTLNQRRVILQRDPGPPPWQQWQFNSVAAARHAYLSQINQLEQQGFIEG